MTIDRRTAMEGGSDVAQSMTTSVVDGLGRENTGRRDVAILAIVWIGMAALANPIGDFPLNDDWVYGAAVRSVLNGRFEVHSFSSANVGPFAYWGALFTSLFGFSFTVLRIPTSILGLAGAVAVYFLSLAFRAHRTVALVTALTIIVNPIYFALSLTFMTDVPFVAIVAASMFAVATGIERGDNRLVVLGLAAAVVGVTFRQFAVVVLAGYVLAHLGRYGVRPKSLIVAVLPLVTGLVLNAAFSEWLVASGRKPYPAGISTLYAVPSTSTLYQLKFQALTVLATVGLFLVPLLPMSLPDRRSLRTRAFAIRAGGVAALALLLVFAFARRDLTVPLMENVLHWYGIGPLTNGDTLMEGIHLPVESETVAAIWRVVTVLALVTAAALIVALAIGAVGLARGWLRPPRAAQTAATSNALFATGVGFAYLVVLALLATSYSLFDRYLLPLVPLAALALPTLFGRNPSAHIAISRTRRASSVALLIAAAAFSVVTTHDYLAWNRTRWDALQALIAQGISPHRIDGGYEFDGWFLYDPLYRVSPSKNWWWVDDDEYLASSGPMPGYSVDGAHPVDRWWKGAGTDVFILHR